MDEKEGTTDGWSFEKERGFIANIVCQRSNFLIVLFGLIIAGAIADKSQFYF